MTYKHKTTGTQTKLAEDGKYYSPDGNWANYVSMLNDEVLEFREKR